MKTRPMIASGAVLLVTAVSAFVYVNNKRNSMDDLFNANVEALASDETGGKKCYNSITSGDGQQVRYCPICEYIPGKPHIWSPDATCR